MCLMRKQGTSQCMQRFVVFQFGCKGTNKFFFFFFLIGKIEILLQPNLSVYACETSSQKLEPQLLPSTPHNHLYLQSDHCTQGDKQVVDKPQIGPMQLALQINSKEFVLCLVSSFPWFLKVNFQAALIDNQASIAAFFFMTTG